VSEWVSGKFADAIVSFGECITNLRSNNWIDYHQLGLNYKLYLFEVLFNRAICYLAMDDYDNALIDLQRCDNAAVLAEHKEPKYQTRVLTQAWKNGQLRQYMPFAVPEGLIYKPPKAKIENADCRDFLGKSKVIASLDPTDNFIGFTAPKLREVVQRLNAPFSRSKRESNASVDEDITSTTGTGRRSSENSNLPSLSLSPTSPFETLKISNKMNVKVRRGSDLRVFVLENPSFEELSHSVRQRFNLDGKQELRLKYVDEDNEEVLMLDQEDMDIALHALQMEGKKKLELKLV
jgi:hypothetical protein